MLVRFPTSDRMVIYSQTWAASEQCSRVIPERTELATPSSTSTSSVHHGRHNPSHQMAIRRAYLLHLLLLFIHRSCLLQERAAAQSHPTDEARLLLKIKSTWGNPPVLSSWNDSAAAGEHCTWRYVQCDAAGSVSGFFLSRVNVTGPFSSNSIYGAFPTSLYRCGSLRYLDMNMNYFSGELPADIGHGLAENLTTLYLAINRFNGIIPRSLSRLRNLRCLDLGYNYFVGIISMELGELTSLQELCLSNNSFDTGRLPASFAKLNNLRRLFAVQCNLVGDFPNSLLDMAELEILFLSNNLLTGSIPPQVWSLKKLQVLGLGKNNLTGDVVVTDSFAAVSLEEIELSENNFTGIIHEVFGCLENLTDLWLDHNRFSGTLPQELGKHSLGLTHVIVDNNELTGTIPKGLCNGGQLMEFSASGNQLNGSIPTGIFNNCNSLLWLMLENNQLTGSLLATLNSNLQFFYIDNNQISGHIPTATAALVEFTASNNQLSGSIPESLGEGMPLLRRLNLSGNQLSGGIPYVA